MRLSLAILAAAAAGFGGTAVSAPQASAATLTPLVHEGAANGNPHMEPIQVMHRGHRWHRHRDRSGRAATAGIVGLGAGLLLGHALSAPRTHYHTYGGYPHYQTYGGHPQYRVYGGYPHGVFGREAGTSLDSRAPHHRP